MDTLKLCFAKKLLSLRTAAGMTQSELGEKLSYSDKTVSKWERGEAIPDALVLKKISRLFSVTVDYLLDDEGEVELPAPQEEPRKKRIFELYPSITQVIMAGIWTVALLVFIILWLTLDLIYWKIFVYALPVTAITLLVINSAWNRGKGNLWIICGLLLSLIAIAYMEILVVKNAWQLWLLAPAAVLLVFLSFRIKRRLDKSRTA